MNTQDLIALAEQCGAETGRMPDGEVCWIKFHKPSIAPFAAALTRHDSAYPLPDDLYAGSKDWVASNYAGRVEWLHVMYESAKEAIAMLETRPDSAAPAGVEPVVVNADYRAMWQEQVELNQRLCTALAAAPKAPAAAQEVDRESHIRGWKDAVAFFLAGNWLKDNAPVWPHLLAPQPPSAPKADERGSAEPVKDCNPEQNQKIMTWQPIKTAPRDGTNILIAFGRDGVSQAKYVPGLPDHPWQFLDTNDGITWLVNYAKDGLGGPSHWKSLPQWPDRAMKGGSGFGSTPTTPARDGSEPGLHASHSAQTATTTTLCEFNSGCTKRCDVCPETVNMADAIAVGDGTLHAAIDYWQARALKAEAPQPPSAPEEP